MAALDERHRADAVFEGGGVKGIAFAGAIAAAERTPGSRNGSTSPGPPRARSSRRSSSPVTTLRACRGSSARREVPAVRRLRAGRQVAGRPLQRDLPAARPGARAATSRSGSASSSPPRRSRKELGKTELTFADVRRRDLPPRSELPNITDEKYERAKYRLHVITSDITSGRMAILPDELPDYEDKDGKPFDKDSFPIVKAVRMSMSYPFLFTPVTLYKGGKPYYMVDGGLLSNFPIWLFDSPNPKRPTWGFRLHPGAAARKACPPESPASTLGSAAPESDVLGRDRGVGPPAAWSRSSRPVPSASRRTTSRPPTSGSRGRCQQPLQLGRHQRSRVLHRPEAAGLPQLVREDRLMAERTQPLAAAPAETVTVVSEPNGGLHATSFTRARLRALRLVAAARQPGTRRRRGRRPTDDALARFEAPPRRDRQRVLVLARRERRRADREEARAAVGDARPPRSIARATGRRRTRRTSRASSTAATSSRCARRRCSPASGSASACSS